MLTSIEANASMAAREATAAVARTMNMAGSAAQSVGEDRPLTPFTPLSRYAASRLLATGFVACAAEPAPAADGPLLVRRQRAARRWRGRRCPRRTSARRAERAVRC